MNRDELYEMLAEDLVAEALAEVEGTLSEREKRELFELLVAEMLTTPEGQRLLRGLAPDPEVQQSEEVAREQAAGGEAEPGESAGDPRKLASGAERKRGGSA
jgi:hypothetical protein